MNIHLDKQILITRSALEILSDIHEFKPRLSFPHVNRTGLSLAQVSELLEGLDSLIPYYIKKCTVTTTALKDGSFNWTMLPEYTSLERSDIASWQEDTMQAVEFLSCKLFEEHMPDYLKVYRACAFLSGFLRFENNPEAHPFIHNAYGAFRKGSCGCQGYARALKLLLEKAGVPCMLICGSVPKDSPAFAAGKFEHDLRTKSTRHYWNLVGIETTDGIQYFHVDACWGQIEGEMGFEFFLKDDLHMQNYLKWDYESYPVCNVLPGEDIEKIVKAGI